MAPALSLRRRAAKVAGTQRKGRTAWEVEGQHSQAIHHLSTTPLEHFLRANRASLSPESKHRRAQELERERDKYFKACVHTFCPETLHPSVEQGLRFDSCMIIWDIDRPQTQLRLIAHPQAVYEGV